MRSNFTSNGDSRAPFTHLESTGWSGNDVILNSQTIVKNTFVDVVDVDLQDSKIKRSASEGDLSKSSDASQDEKGYWLPSLWSSSNSSDRRKLESVQGGVDTTPWLFSGNTLPDQPRGGLSSPMRPSGNGFSYVNGTPQNFQYLPHQGMAASSSSKQHQANKPPHRTHKSTEKKPPGIMQGGPPAPPTIKEPSAPEYMPSSNFPTTYRESGSSSFPVQPRRPSAEMRSIFSTIWGANEATQSSATGHPQSTMPKASAQSFEGHAPQLEGSAQGKADADSASLVGRIHDEMRGRVTMEKLEELAENGVLSTIPRNESNALTSVGSVQHFGGTCTPCAYWFKGICKYTIACHYCHFVHAGQKSKRLRPSKQTRMRIRKWEAEMAGSEKGAVTGDPANFNCDSDEYTYENERDDDRLPDEMVQSRHLLNL